MSGRTRPASRHRPVRRRAAGRMDCGGRLGAWLMAECGATPAEAARALAAIGAFVLFLVVVLPRLMYLFIAPMKGWC